MNCRATEFLVGVDQRWLRGLLDAAPLVNKVASSVLEYCSSEVQVKISAGAS